jgi:hypothetical protein
MIKTVIRINVCKWISTFLNIHAENFKCEWKILKNSNMHMHLCIITRAFHRAMILRDSLVKFMSKIRTAGRPFILGLTCLTPY